MEELLPDTMAWTEEIDGPKDKHLKTRWCFVNYLRKEFQVRLLTLFITSLIEDFGFSQEDVVASHPGNIGALLGSADVLAVHLVELAPLPGVHRCLPAEVDVHAILRQIEARVDVDMAMADENALAWLRIGRSSGHVIRW